MLKDLGFPDSDYIIRSLGEERILFLTRMMLRSIEPPINVLVWKTYYGIDCTPVTSKKLGERLLPPLNIDQVTTLRRKTRKMLMYHERIQILASVVNALPPQPKGQQ